MVAASDRMQGGQVSAAFVPGRGQLYLVGSLPDPSKGRVYQVWLVGNGAFHDAGTFLPDAGLVLLRISADPSGYDGVLITEEPASGSHSPSSRHVVTAAF